MEPIGIAANVAESASSVVEGQSVGEALAAKEAAKKAATRTRIAMEIVTTERAYVESLQMAMNFYYKPLQKIVSKFTGGGQEPLISASEFQIIFASVPKVLELNEELLAKLEERVGDEGTFNVDETCIGDVLESMGVERFDVYGEYVAQWDASNLMLKKCTDKPEFADLLAQFGARAKGKLDLFSLLIMPVQRVPRYVLLLRELIKHTPKTHPDYENLVRAQKMMEEVGQRINTRRGEFDDRLVVAKENAALLLRPRELTQRHRRLIRTGMVTSRDEGGKLHLALFNDLLVAARTLSTMSKLKGRLGSSNEPVTSIAASKVKELSQEDLALMAAAEATPPPEMYKYAMSWELQSIMLDESPGSGGKHSMLLEGFSRYDISPSHRTLVVTAPSEKEKADWVAAIREATLAGTGQEWPPFLQVRQEALDAESGSGDEDDDEEGGGGSFLGRRAKSERRKASKDHEVSGPVGEVKKRDMSEILASLGASSPEELMAKLNTGEGMIGTAAPLSAAQSMPAGPATRPGMERSQSFDSTDVVKRKTFRGLFGRRTGSMADPVTTIGRGEPAPALTETQLKEQRALAFIKAGDYASAKQALKQAAVLSPKSPSVWYNFACSHALSGDKRQAFEHLHQALECGYLREYGESNLASDPDLEGVRAMPGYKELLEKYRVRDADAIATLAMSPRGAPGGSSSVSSSPRPINAAVERPKKSFTLLSPRGKR